MHAARGAGMSARAPWWLEGGTETCGHCTRVYAYHVERRCYACDQPMCPFCITTVSVSVDVVCPACGAEEDGGHGEQGRGEGSAGRASSPEGEDG